MTPNELKIAVALNCGWKLDENGPRADAFGSSQGTGKKTMKWVFKGNYLTPWRTHRVDADLVLPDYPSDLNAMHAAIQTLDDSQKWAMFTELARIVKADIPAAFGTAAEYAEAFLAVKRSENGT